MFPQIRDVIYKTFRGVQDSLEQRANTFEIYGLDLILDQNLKPWVIEVNLSPACNERTDFLTKMLDDMTIDVLQHIENRIILQNTVDTEWVSNFKERKDQLLKRPQLSINLNEEAFYQENKIENRWERIYDCIQEQKDYQLSLQITQNNPFFSKNELQQLEVIGIKCDQKYEKKIDKAYLKMRSIDLIQRVYRGHRSRKQALLIKQNKQAPTIQKHLRSYLACSKVQNLILNKKSIIIQTRLRQFIAYSLTQLLIALKRKKAKLYIAIKVQSHYRRLQAYKQFIYLKRKKAAAIIQQRLKQYLAKIQAKKMMAYQCKIVKIQRYYKMRLRIKRNASIKIQKAIKAYSAYKKVQRLKEISKGCQLLILMLKRKSLMNAYQRIRKWVAAVKIQSYIKRQIVWKKIKIMKQNQGQMKLKHLFLTLIAKNLHQYAQAYNKAMKEKSVLIQRHLKRYLALKKVQQIRVSKILNKKAIIIQKYLRSYLAKSLVDYKIIQRNAILCIQGFARMMIAKRRVRILKAQYQKQDVKKQKQIEKKFEKTKKVEKDIENYIESLFHREIQQQKQLKSVISQTPHSQRKSHSQLKTESNRTSRQILTSQTNLRNTKEFMKTTIIIQPQASEIQPNTQLDVRSSQSGEENNEVLATSAVMMGDDDQSTSTNQTNSNNIERQQKALRIRKSKNGGVTAAPTTYLNNLVVNKGVRGTHKTQITNKMSNALGKVKGSQQNTHRQITNGSTVSSSHGKASGGPKPKTFAENLMNMLALQNIGQVFSENPIEALSILKEPSKDPQSARKRRNSNVSNINNASFVSNQKLLPSTYQVDGGHSNIQTLDSQHTKAIHFPKLTDFKSATNNIYLAQRPLADPRQESEYQLQMLEAKLRIASDQLNKSTTNQCTLQQSRTELQGANESLHRRSTEDLALNMSKNHHQQQTSVQYQEYMPEMMARPSKDLAHQMVVQAYKKSQQLPQHTNNFKKGSTKKRGESLGPTLHTSGKKKEGVESNGKGTGKREMGSYMPSSIMDNNSKLIII